MIGQSTSRASFCAAARTSLGRRFGVAQEITELRGRLRYFPAVAEMHDPHVIPA